MIARPLALLCLLSAVASAPALHAQTTPAPALPDSPGQSSALAPSPEPTGPTVLFDTSMGRMQCRLFTEQAPLATANFIGLAQGTKDFTDPVTGKHMHHVRFYDGTTFHRVIPGFMIQGGDRVGNGTGDPGFSFKNETQPNLTFNVPGRLAMANAGPDTNGTQFFITELPYPDLDGKYTIFGQCDPHTVLVVASIARVDRDGSDKPVTPVTLNKVVIIPAGQPVPPDPNAAPAGSTAPAPPSSTSSQ